MAWTTLDLDTPAVIIDLDRVEANLVRAQDYADAHGLALRPHVKTHKLPELALRQVELGAVGITCQKLGEAEVMADTGLDDILITFNLVGPAKLRRARELARRVKLSLSVDDAGVATALAEAGVKADILIECDTGAGRCGVSTPAAAVELARAVDRLPGLTLRGLMTYPPQGRPAEVGARLAETTAAMAAAGLACEVVSTGGTPDMLHAATYGGTTEHRPGTYIYSDRSQAARGWGSLADCALRVLATVVSTPTPDRAVLDAGSKTFSSDLLGMNGFGHIVEYPELALTSLNEEHGMLDCSQSRHRPTIGERVTVIPNHACVISNLFDTVYGVRAGVVERRLTVAARGRVG